jgi:predicted amidohydrolase YtcJ
VFDDVVAAVSAARRHGRTVAVHAVTAAAAALAVAAIEAVGPLPGDRIEHGAVVPLGLAESIARLGLTVVTNPGFLRTRGDRYLVDVEPGERDDLWRCRSLVDGGVRVAAGSDAPFGPADPWLAMAAAVDRRTASGVAVLARGRASRRHSALDAVPRAARTIQAARPVEWTSVRWPTCAC